MRHGMAVGSRGGEAPGLAGLMVFERCEQEHGNEPSGRAARGSTEQESRTANRQGLSSSGNHLATLGLHICPLLCSSSLLISPERGHSTRLFVHPSEVMWRRRETGETLATGEKREERGGIGRRQKEEKGDSRTRSKAERTPRLFSLAPFNYIAITYAKPREPAISFSAAEMA